MKFNKNTLQNDQLLQDIKREAWADDVIKALRQRKITTYKSLFALIRDNSRDPQLRADICEEIRRLYLWIDRRRFVPPLLEALKTDYEPLLQNAIQALGNLESKRALTPLMHLVVDKTKSLHTRYFTILALVEGIKDIGAIPALRQVMFDRNDDIKVREDVIEQTAWFFDQSLVADYIELLSDPEPDIRFWAAYGFAIMRVDISSALSELDRIAATDHIAPNGWWHIDRETFRSLENIYWQLLGLGSTEKSGQAVFVISPAPEYATFEWRFSRWYEKLPKLRPPDLKVDPTWLVTKLRKQWPSVKMNVRDPRPQTYLINWLVEIEGEPLIGGLHYDQYAVVITGSLEVIRTFAVWYRSIIEPQQYLFLYEWAGLAIELRTGMSADDIKNERDERDKLMNALDEQAIEYPWVIETE